MIKLLQKNSLTVRDTFTAEKFALNMSERQSTATITIGPEAPTLTVGDWLQDMDNPGWGIVWRVKSIDTDYATNTRTVNCEHMIQSLKDMIMFGEVTPATITGNKKAEECTSTQAVRYVLKQQSDWVLGTLEFVKSNPYSFNGDDLFSALETISSSLADVWWTYDFTSYPFKLNIMGKSTSVNCEMRMSRNLKTIKRTIDRSRMFTRFYPIGKNNLQLKDKYINKNTDLYGVICKVETDNSKDSTKKLKNWANERLSNHAEPLVTVTISGLELAASTGEPLDRLTLGTVCRVPLPEFGTTITERITKLSWSDKIADPESVTVTLANEYTDLASIINTLQKSTSSGGRSAAKNAGEDHAWINDTSDKVELVAEAVAGKDGDGANWSRVSTLTVSGNGIDARVTKAQGDIIACEAAIEILEGKIALEVKERTEEDGELSAAIKITAGKIEQVVTAVGKDGKVTAASIVLAVNESGSSVHINADKIYLLGQTIANTITADFINTKLATVANVVVKKLSLSANGSIYLPTGDGGVSITGAGASDFIRNLKIELSGNTYTLSKITLGDSTWQAVGSFSRATTLTGAWSSGKFTASASPQGSTFWTELVQGDYSRDGGTIEIKVNAIDQDSGGNSYYTGRKVSHTFSTMGITRAVAYRDSSGNAAYYGKLYYYDNRYTGVQAYKQASTSDQYWYYSSTNKSGSTTLLVP